jgi:hypothetical protein
MMGFFKVFCFSSFSVIMLASNINHKLKFWRIIMKHDLTGKEFESITEKVFRSIENKNMDSMVEKNIKLKSADGERQIDVLITHDTGYCKIKTIVECKDHNNKINIIYIDGLYSKMVDVNANKAIMVSKKGYTKGAKQKANRLGISLFTLNEIKENDWDITSNLSIIVKEYYAYNLIPFFSFKLNKKTDLPIDFNYYINDRDVSQLFQDLMLKEKLEIDCGKTLEWHAEEIKKPHYFRDSEKNKVFVEKYKISYMVRKKYFFGYVSQLPDNLSLKDVLSSKKSIFVKAEALTNYRSFFNEYTTEKDIPTNPIVGLKSITCPNMNLLPGEAKIQHADTGGILNYTTKINNKTKNQKH